jgi:hypothetical protein
LGALHLSLDSRLNVPIEVQLFNLNVENICNAGEPCCGIEDTKKFLLLLNAELQVCGDGV